MTEEKIQQADCVHLAAPGSLSALRAATVGRPVGVWQPIETAPKDERILVCGGSFHRTDEIHKRPARVALVVWMPESDGWWGGYLSGGAEAWYEPTHWMPLPGAPTGQSRTSEAGEATCASNEPDEQDQAEFELHCDGEFAAGASGPRIRAWAEIQHYAAQYAQDGSVEIYEVKRTLAARDGSSVSQGMAQDAARYRWIRERVGAGYKDVGSLAPSFHLPRVHPVGNIMQGCVAQHLDAAIDAALPPLPQPTGERE